MQRIQVDTKTKDSQKFANPDESLIDEENGTRSTKISASHQPQWQALVDCQESRCHRNRVRSRVRHEPNRDAQYQRHCDISKKEEIDEHVIEHSERWSG
jgi:hypothetical protein